MKNSNILNIIEKHHNKCRNKTKIKLYKKLVSARTRWAKQNNTTPELIEKMIISLMGKPCKYCGEKLTAQNISIDHEIPLDRGGIAGIKNITIICKRCNTRKDIMTDTEYYSLISFLEGFDSKPRAYVLKKLSMSSMTFYK